MHDNLYSGIQDYAATTVMTKTVYSPDVSPYFFIDTDGDGDTDPEESLTSDNAYKDWTPRLLRVAYNYHYVVKDPGSYTHNPLYVIQVLYDSASLILAGQ